MEEIEIEHKHPIFFIGSEEIVDKTYVSGGSVPLQQDCLFCFSCDMGDIKDKEMHTMFCGRAHSILRDIKTSICVAAVGNCRNLLISSEVKEAVIDILLEKEVIVIQAGGGGVFEDGSHSGDVEVLTTREHRHPSSCAAHSRSNSLSEKTLLLVKSFIADIENPPQIGRCIFSRLLDSVVTLMRFHSEQGVDRSSTVIALAFEAISCICTIINEDGWCGLSKKSLQFILDVWEESLKRSDTCVAKQGFKLVTSILVSEDLEDYDMLDLPFLRISSLLLKACHVMDTLITSPELANHACVALIRVAEIYGSMMREEGGAVPQRAADIGERQNIVFAIKALISLGCESEDVNQRAAVLVSTIGRQIFEECTAKDIPRKKKTAYSHD
jgi:hypothetical protein